MLAGVDLLLTVTCQDRATAPAVTGKTWMAITSDFPSLVELSVMTASRVPSGDSANPRTSTVLICLSITWFPP